MRNTALKPVDGRSEITESENGSFRRSTDVANALLGLYRRHCAGKPRWTRDVFLLEEIVTKLERVRQRIVRSREFDSLPMRMRNQVVAIDRVTKQCRSERDAVLSVRTLGASKEQLTLFAALANEQFRWFDVHLAGKPRMTRRPELLERMLKALGDILRRMDTASMHPRWGRALHRDRSAIETHVAILNTELAQIQKIRISVDPSTLCTALGYAAEDVVARAVDIAPRGSVARDVLALANCCDELTEIVFQLDTLLDASADGDAIHDAVHEARQERELSAFLSELFRLERLYEEALSRCAPSRSIASPAA